MEQYTTEEQRILNLLVDNILAANVKEVEVLPSVYIEFTHPKIDDYRGYNDKLRRDKRDKDAMKYAEKYLNDLKNLELI